MWLPLAHPPTGDLARNPDMSPDWESNWGPFDPLSHTSQGYGSFIQSKHLVKNYSDIVLNPAEAKQKAIPNSQLVLEPHSKGG